MYKKILVPLDGSKRSEAILPHVEELAHNLQAQVIFMQVIEPQYRIPEASMTNFIEIQKISYEAMADQVKAYLSGIAGEFREKNINAKSIAEEGPVIHSIMSIAAREDVDLIAMASHGRTGLPRVFYGSVAASLLHSVDRPILLVRADGQI